MSATPEMPEVGVRRFDAEFEIELTKAYKDGDGTPHVIGIASDDAEDLTGDRMHKDCISDMVGQAKRMKLPLLDNHYSTFGFGHTHDAEMKKNADGQNQYVVDFKLDSRYPQAVDLYNEVERGTCQKQLSVGGTMDLRDPDSYTYEENKKTGRYNRVIKKIKLDHIATTRPKRAAVPRTKFVSAIVKSLEGIVPEQGAEVEKAVVKYSKYPTDESSGWSFSGADGDALIEKGGWALFKAAHTWFDSGSGTTPQEKGAYKLPHHKLKNGEMTTYKRGVIAAMQRAGQAQVSSGDLAGIRAHLSQHYREFGMEPPTGKALEDFDAFLKHHEEQGIEMGWLRKEAGMGTNEESASGSETASKERTTVGDNATTTTTTTPAAPTVDKAKQEQAALGLDLLSKIGSIFKGKPEDTLPEQIVTLVKSSDGLAGIVLTEKSIPEVRKVHAAIGKLLSGAGVPGYEPGSVGTATEPKVEKGLTAAEIESIVVKALEARVSKVEGGLKAGLEALTETLGKGLTEMATGINTKIDTLSKEQKTVEEKLDTRLKTIESVSGVRQSQPGQDVTKSAQAPQAPGSRKPDEKNPFRGMFDRVRAQAQSKMATGR